VAAFVARGTRFAEVELARADGDALGREHHRRRRLQPQVEGLAGDERVHLAAPGVVLPAASRACAQRLAGRGGPGELERVRRRRAARGQRRAGERHLRSARRAVPGQVHREIQRRVGLDAATDLDRDVLDPLLVREHETGRGALGDDGGRLQRAADRALCGHRAGDVRHEVGEPRRREVERQFTARAQATAGIQAGGARRQRRVDVEQLAVEAEIGVAVQRPTVHAAVGQGQLRAAAPRWLQRAVDIQAPVQARVDAGHEARQVERLELGAQLRRRLTAELDAPADRGAAVAQARERALDLECFVGEHDGEVDVEREASRVARASREALPAGGHLVVDLARCLRRLDRRVDARAIDAREGDLGADGAIGGTRHARARGAASRFHVVERQFEHGRRPLQGAARCLHRQALPVERAGDGVGGPEGP
jgi:hypothetical protein